MRKLIKYILILIIIPTLFSCYREENISEVPYIEFRNLSYIPGPSYDSLVLSFYFEDGNGDVGLFSEETFPPYHPFDFVIDSEDSIVTLNSDSKPPFRLITPGSGQEQFYSETDNRAPYNCEDYAIIALGQTSDAVDTFFIKKNEYHYNLHLTFLRKINGVYTEVNLETAFGTSNCTISFDGRIPVFDEETLKAKRPVRGTITYPMTSGGFPFIFGNDEFKIEFYIYDFELNKSNVTSTPDLTLLGITK
ncbi:MAG: hypothetical protein ACFHWX_03020 [Bacteroidota bacterium]